jgi:hypothetical protein
VWGAVSEDPETLAAEVSPGAAEAPNAPSRNAPTHTRPRKDEFIVWTPGGRPAPAPSNASAPQLQERTASDAPPPQARRKSDVRQPHLASGTSASASPTSATPSMEDPSRPPWDPSNHQFHSWSVGQPDVTYARPPPRSLAHAVQVLPPEVARLGNVARYTPPAGSVHPTIHDPATYSRALPAGTVQPTIHDPATYSRAPVPLAPADASAYVPSASLGRGSMADPHVHGNVPGRPPPSVGPAYSVPNHVAQSNYIRPRAMSIDSDGDAISDASYDYSDDPSTPQSAPGLHSALPSGVTRGGPPHPGQHASADWRRMADAMDQDMASDPGSDTNMDVDADAVGTGGAGQDDEGGDDDEYERLLLASRRELERAREAAPLHDTSAAAAILPRVLGDRPHLDNWLQDTRSRPTRRVSVQQPAVESSARPAPSARTAPARQPRAREPPVPEPRPHRAPEQEHNVSHSPVYGRPVHGQSAYGPPARAPPPPERHVYIHRDQDPTRAAPAYASRPPTMPEQRAYVNPPHPTAPHVPAPMTTGSLRAASWDDEPAPPAAAPPPYTTRPTHPAYRQYPVGYASYGGQSPYTAHRGYPAPPGYGARPGPPPHSASASQVLRTAEWAPRAGPVPRHAPAPPPQARMTAQDPSQARPVEHHPAPAPPRPAQEARPQPVTKKRKHPEDGPADPAALRMEVDDDDEEQSRIRRQLPHIDPEDDSFKLKRRGGPVSRWCEYYNVLSSLVRS